MSQIYRSPLRFPYTKEAACFLGLSPTTFETHDELCGLGLRGAQIIACTP
jgi:hypothetical protein